MLFYWSLCSLSEQDAKLFSSRTSSYSSKLISTTLKMRHLWAAHSTLLVWRTISARSSTTGSSSASSRPSSSVLVYLSALMDISRRFSTECIGNPQISQAFLGAILTFLPSIAFILSSYRQGLCSLCDSGLSQTVHPQKASKMHGRRRSFAI